MAPEYAHSLFAVAHTDLGSLPFNNHGRTLRLVVEANVAAHALAVTFSNRCGGEVLPVGAASLALCDENGVLQPGTLCPITMGGTLSFELQPGEDRRSDRVPFRLQPGDFFALNIYYPTDTRVASGNWVSNHSLRSRPGNYSADPQFRTTRLMSRLARTITTSDMTVPITSVFEITAFCPSPPRLLACFGDSITQQGNWTVPLAKRLYRAYPGKISLCNLGISGNRLLGPSPLSLGGLYGEAGMARFEHDVLGLHGLTHAVLALGTNDLGHPGAHGVPDDELITLAQYANAMQALAGLLHEKGVRVCAATLCPRPIQKPYDEEREALRREMNRWIRTAPCFDAVLDFDTVLRRDDGEAGMKDGCALPDRLHPSPFGGLWMAKSIDISLFGG